MKINKILAGVLACAVIGGTAPCIQNTRSFAESVTASDTEVKTSGIFTYEINTTSGDNNQITITACDTSAEGVVDIPNEIDGLPVTKIKSKAFMGCAKITVINIPENVTDTLGLLTESPKTETKSILEAVNVDENNKSYCSENGILFNKDKSSLVKYPPAHKGESYTIPESVTNIEYGAFFRNTYLKSVTIPANVELISLGAFMNCTSLESVTIEYGVRDIAGMAFDGCTSLKEVNIPSTVGTIYAGTFANCTNLEKVVMEEGVRVINSGGFLEVSGAFEGCTKLSDITFPETLVYIGQNTFKDTAWFENQPEGMVYINNIAYRYKGDICPESEFTFKDNIITISGGVFENVKGINSIIVPESVIELSGEEFIYCDDLNSITILNPECSIFGNILVDDNNFPDVDYSSIYHGIIKGYANSTAQTYAEENENEFIEITESVSAVKGDANSDGIVDVADVVAISAYVADPKTNTLSGQAVKNCDVHNTGDGLTPNDSLMIQQFIAGIITEL